MKLFTSPLACSMASRITCEELALPVEVLQVDTTTRRAPDGSEVHPLGLVPVLHTDDGRRLTENAAILPYLAAGSPLVPADPWQRTLLAQWLSFVGTELHKVIFYPLLDPDAPEGARAYALASAPPRLAVLDAHLATSDYLLADYTVADIYLATVLNWAQVTPLRLADYPAITAYLARIRSRPAFARVLASEMSAYLAERASA